MNDAPWLVGKPLGRGQTVDKTPVWLGRRPRAAMHGVQPQALHAVWRRQGLDGGDVFRRYEWRKSQSDRIDQEGREIQYTETEPDERYHGW